MTTFKCIFAFCASLAITLMAIMFIASLPANIAAHVPVNSDNYWSHVGFWFFVAIMTGFVSRVVSISMTNKKFVEQADMTGPNGPEIASKVLSSVVYGVAYAVVLHFSLSAYYADGIVTPVLLHICAALAWYAARPTGNALSEKIQQGAEAISHR